MSYFRAGKNLFYRNINCAAPSARLRSLVFKSLTYCNAAIFTALISAGCQAASVPPSITAETAPRIVSLDFCADQYALELLPPEQIAALSPDARAEFSYHKDRAQNIPSVRPRAEDVLALKPDLIIRSYGGGPQAARLFEAAGIPVVNIGWATTLSGDGPGSVAAIIKNTAQALGQAQKGERLIAAYHMRLERLSASKSRRPTALYMTPYGVTTGAGSLVDQIMTAAGYDNFQTQSGWHPIPLERLARDTPDHVIASFFDSHAAITANWSAMRHPVAQRALSGRQALPLKGAWTSCGAWFLMDAAEALAPKTTSFNETATLKEDGS